MPDLLDGLNEQQLRAVTSTAPVILCLAGAGSGKTTVLTRRVAYLHHEHRVGTINMLCLTFTRLAGKEMKERIMKLVGDVEGKKLFCNTFHAFAVQVLRRWGHKLGIEENFTIYDQDDRSEIIQRIIEDFGNKTTLKKVLDRHEQCGDYRIEQQRYPEECRVLMEYGYRCKQNNAVDLDRLIDLVIRLWELHPDVLAEYQHDYSHVFVDEFQDTGDDQMRMIELLDPRNLFVVGDDFQAIYGWRSARVEYILNFPDRYPGCEVVKLEDNYRSTEQIVDVANRLIKHNINQTEKKLIAHRSGAQIVVYKANDITDEASNIARLIKFQNQISLKDIAVLSRTNSKVEFIHRCLEDEKIPAQRIVGHDDPYKSPAVRPIMNWMYFLQNKRDNIAFKKCAQRFGITDTQITQLEIEALSNELSLYEALLYSSTDAYFGQVVNGLESELEQAGTVAEWFDTIADVINITYHSSLDRAYKAIETWQKSKCDLGEDYSVRSFLKYLRYKDIQEKLIEERDAVKLMTVHASKGLEFNTVFVVGVNQDVFPSKRGDIEEERRLFYVALTRAKNRLIISYPEAAPDWRGSPIVVKPSQFLSEICSAPDMLRFINYARS